MIFALHSGSFTQFREDLFPLKKRMRGRKRLLPADNGADARRWGEKYSDFSLSACICVICGQFRPCSLFCLLPSAFCLCPPSRRKNRASQAPPKRRLTKIRNYGLIPPVRCVIAKWHRLRPVPGRRVGGAAKRDGNPAKLAFRSHSNEGQ